MIPKNPGTTPKNVPKIMAHPGITTYASYPPELTTGSFIYKRTSDVNDRKVYRMVSKKKYVIGETFHPVLGKEVRCILYNAGKSGSKPTAQLIVLKKGDVDNVIEWFYNHFKGEMLENWIKE